MSPHTLSNYERILTVVWGLRNLEAYENKRLSLSLQSKFAHNHVHDKKQLELFQPQLLEWMDTLPNELFFNEQDNFLNKYSTQGGENKNLKISE